jgi:membrane-bound metal-dependent hydrolase YbcI (DUF457 family)
MLPPGHVAGGFFTAAALLKIAKPDLPPEQLHQLLYWGMFFGFAPDLDNFAAFAKIHSWWYKKGVDNTIHRKFYSHIPVLWLIAGLLIYFLAAGTYIKYIGLLLWLGSWSHFILDSIDFGVMWLWPFNKEVWALRNRGIHKDIEAGSFISYWGNFLKVYVTRWTFYIEIVLLISALFFIRL